MSHECCDHECSVRHVSGRGPSRCIKLCVNFVSPLLSTHCDRAPARSAREIAEAITWRSRKECGRDSRAAATSAAGSLFSLEEIDQSFGDQCAISAPPGSRWKRVQASRFEPHNGLAQAMIGHRERRRWGSAGLQVCRQPAPVEQHLSPPTQVDALAAPLDTLRASRRDNVGFPPRAAEGSRRDE